MRSNPVKYRWEEGPPQSSLVERLVMGSYVVGVGMWLWLIGRLVCQFMRWALS